MLAPLLPARRPTSGSIGEAHGTDGPLKVSNHEHVCDLSHAYVRTLQGMGHAFRPDFNAGEQRGVGYMQAEPAVQGGAGGAVRSMPSCAR